MTHSKSDITKALKDILAGGRNSIRSAVAQEALDYDNPESFFSDLLQHGCISGMVNSLIYYTDTHAFYDRHYDIIECMREDMESNLGEPLTIKGDLKNFMAWFAFEETACQIAMELDLI